MGNHPSNLDKPNRSIQKIVTQRSKSEEDFYGVQTQPNTSTQTESDIPSRISTNRRLNQAQPRPLTPNRQYPGNREPKSGLDYLAFDSKPEMGRRLPPGEIRNINKALKFAGLHQALKPEKGESMKLNGGPLLGFDLDTISESFPLNADVVAGRMSFSNNLNDFCQKYKFRVETYDTASETIRLDSLSQDIRLKGDRKKLLAESSKLDASRGNRFFNVTPSLEREFSPEFVFGQTHNNNSYNYGPRENQNQFDDDTERAFGQPTEYYEPMSGNTQSRRAVNYSDVQGAISRIKQKEEESQSPQHDRSPPRVASLPNINRPTVFRPNTSGSNKSGKASPTNSPLRGTSPTFVIGKPAGTGKPVAPRVTTTRSPIREKGSTKQSPTAIAARPKSPISSKKASHSESQTVFVDIKSKKMPASKPTIETSGSRSPHRHVIEGLKPQPQTTKAENNKKFWKEAERPSPTNRKTSLPKTTDRLKTETKSQPSSATSIPKSTTTTLKTQKNQNTKTDSSPLASEYIKYRYATNQSQGQLGGASIPVKTFDLASHTPSTSHMSMAGGMENFNNPNNPYYSSIRSKPETIEDKIEHPRYPPPQSEPESRDLNDLTSDDDIEPVEATLDLSAYMTRPQQTQSLQEPPRDFHVHNFNRGGSESDLHKYWDSDSHYKRSTEPDLVSKLTWQSEAKKNSSTDIRPRHNNYMQSYAQEQEDEPIEEREAEDNEREEEDGNENPDEDYSVDVDENSYVDDLKQRLATLTGTGNDDLIIRANLDLSKGQIQGKELEAIKKGSMRRYEQDEGEDVDLKENDKHLSNKQRDDRVFASGGDMFEKKTEPRSAGFITDNRIYGKNNQRYFPENI